MRLSTFLECVDFCTEWWPSDEEHLLDEKKAFVAHTTGRRRKAQTRKAVKQRYRRNKTLSQNTLTQHNHTTLSNNTVTQHCHTTLSHKPITQHSHTTLSHNTVTKHCHTRHTQHYHTTLLHNTITRSKLPLHVSSLCNSWRSNGLLGVGVQVTSSCFQFAVVTAD